MTVHEVTALFCLAFYILFESTSCIRLKVGAAKRDVIEGKGSNSTVQLVKLASLIHLQALRSHNTDQTRDNTPEHNG